MPRILVIDDEDDVRSAIVRRLERAGFQVDQATSEEEGVRMIHAVDPSYDLIVTDMVMEDPRSGVKTLEAALTRDVFTEVIVLTAYGNVANAVECMRRGAFDYVEKNIPGVDVFELLMLKIHQALERRRMSLLTLRRYAPIARQQQIDLPSIDEREA